jgi:hypothetical protein
METGAFGEPRVEEWQARAACMGTKVFGQSSAAWGMIELIFVLSDNCTSIGYLFNVRRSHYLELLL